MVLLPHPKYVFTSSHSLNSMMGSIRGTGVFSLKWHSAVTYSETSDNEDELAFMSVL